MACVGAEDPRYKGSGVAEIRLFCRWLTAAFRCGRRTRRMEGTGCVKVTPARTTLATMKSGNVTLPNDQHPDADGDIRGAEVFVPR